MREQELAKQIETAHKQAEADVNRIQRRAEADKADLKADIGRLEVELMKVSAALRRLV